MRMPFQDTRYPSFLSTSQEILKKTDDQSDEAYTKDVDSDSDSDNKNNDTRTSEGLISD